MTYLTSIDDTAVNIIHARAQWFLWDQRHRRGNDDWFTVEQIAADFGERPPIIPLIIALKDLAGTGSIEADEDGDVRHV